MNIYPFPMETKAKPHTPHVALRMQPAMRQALETYGERNGIGDLSAVIRFACASLLRTDGALPAHSEKTDAKAS